jgi:hypothetical protein
MEIPIGELPTIVGNFLGIGPVAGGLLLSGFFLFGILIALNVLGVNILGEAIAGVAFLGLFTALGWFPIWLMLIIAFITAVMVADKVSKAAKVGGE